MIGGGSYIITQMGRAIAGTVRELRRQKMAPTIGPTGDRMECLVGDWQELLVERMELAEATGCCVVQKHLIEAFGRRVAETASSRLKKVFTEFKTRAEANFRLEAEHGAGSLLVMDHPLNLRLAAKGY
ncbi:hypothetical protein LP421_02735 (plasmid) [Rhizobium sp. RCAM05350]|nr:hypothetical protein LP421_02735 [Rhizobium sp. RCAM05350]